MSGYCPLQCASRLRGTELWASIAGEDGFRKRTKQQEIVRQVFQEEKIKMASKLWKKFEKLTEKCYSNMIGAEPDGMAE